MNILCLIPAFNEKGNLSILTQKLITVLQKEKVRFTLFFIIQGDDGSLREIKKLQKKYPPVKFLFFPKPLGIGKAYQIGFAKVEKQFSHVLTLDADLNHNPSEIPKFIKSLQKTKSDLVIGSRFIKGGKFNDKRLWKRCVSFAVNYLITTLINIPVHDITSGFRLIKREVIEKTLNQLKEKGYPSYMELLLFAHRQHFRLQEVSITYTPRRFGKSKMNKMATIKDYLFYLPKILVFSYFFKTQTKGTPSITRL